MHRFIFNSLRQMLNSTYLCLIFIYALLCWIITGAGIAQKGMLSTREITGLYQMVFLSLVIVNSIYFIITHFRETLNSTVRDTLIVRLGKQKFFWGLIVSYILYLIIFNFLPLLLTAFVQDVIYNETQTDLNEYIFSAFRVTAWAGFWPVLLAVILIVWLKNDLITLISWSLVYLIFSGIHLLSGQYIAENGDTPLSAFPLIISLSLPAVMFLAASYLSRRLNRYEYNEKISGGLFSFIAGLLGFDMTMFHYRMMGFRTQVLYLIFGIISFILMFTLFSGMNADNVVISKMFVAVIFPLLFSLNQYSLISIDLESGMIITNVMKKVSYDRVVFNRWISMLLPQVLFSVIISSVLMNLIPETDASFMTLAVGLNVLFSSMNFYLSVHFNRSGYANFIVGFLAYLMLREDVQRSISSNNIFNRLNIFESITSFSRHTPALSHLVILVCMIVLFVTLTRIRLRTIQRQLNNGFRLAS